MVDLVAQCKIACDELIDATGRAATLAVLQMSAIEAAVGAPQQGRKHAGEVVCYGHRPRQVFLDERKLQVTRMAETAGVSRSAASWATVQTSQAEIEALVSRRFDDLKLLAAYVDRRNFGEDAMDGAVGLDSEGHMHVPGIREGTTENATVVTDLLEDIVLRCADTKRKMLFVIDGSKALRRYQRRLRYRPEGITLPRTQAAQRARLAAQGRQAWGQKRAAGGLETGHGQGHRAHQEAGRIAGAKVSAGGGQSAGRPGGAFHR